MTAIPITLTEIFKHIHVQIAYAFGSRARELKDYLNANTLMDTTSLSDLDIGIKISEGLSFSVHDKVRLAVDLEDLLARVYRLFVATS
jgi:predicted nucleotidyltransferase